MKFFLSLLFLLLWQISFSQMTFAEMKNIQKMDLNRFETYCLSNGYEFNSVEFAIRDGIPYAINFCNPIPDADARSIGNDNFEWLVEATANYAIELAQHISPKKNNLTWGKYITDSSQKIN